LTSVWCRKNMLHVHTYQYIACFRQQILPMRPVQSKIKRHISRLIMVCTVRYWVSIYFEKEKSLNLMNGFANTDLLRYLALEMLIYIFQAIWTICMDTFK
jgi:hypothetical protein